MRGRKPRPTNLHLVDGTGDNPGIAKPRYPKPPTCPAHLNPTAKAEWKRLATDLHRRGIVGENDRAALAAYCQAYGRWVEAERKLKDTPMLIKLPSGYIQQSPWLAIANKQLELLHKYLAELGLSPVSRSRVTQKRHIGPRPKPWEDNMGYDGPGLRPADRYLTAR
jgi:P27 family predicted phage terminase small subunit